jgi:hypothetical protein
MTSFSQAPRDRILWILANNDWKMERSRLRAATRMRYALLNPILDELTREGRIRITVGKQGDLVSLISGLEEEEAKKKGWWQFWR